MDVEFKHSTYTPHRIRPLRAYIDRMTAYLQLHHPEASPEQLRAFVEQKTKERLQHAQADVLYHPIPGNTERKTVNLLHHLHEKMGQNIITPSGSTYVLPTVRESFLKVTLADKKAKRAVFKKAMLKALAAGDMFLVSINNYLQATTKIFLNSAPGAMGSEHNILYDLPGYNSITSTARHSVKYGYAHVERLIEGNLYLRSYGHMVNYCLGLIKVIPDNWAHLLVKHQLYHPSVEDVTAYLTTSMQYYMLGVPTEKITDFLRRLTGNQRAFIFYASNMRNLVRFNDDMFRTFFHQFFHTDVPVDNNANPRDVSKVEHDLLAMITAINYEILGKDPESGNYFEVEQAIEHNPDGVRRIIAIAHHMETQLAMVAELLTAIFRVDTDLANLRQQENMIRKCVIVSDTDSVIFSTQSMVEWYSGTVTFNRSSYEINAFTVYLISRSLEHVFARLSCGFGMVGKDIHMITMKNEFLYPIMMRGPIKKHYAGISTIQEGKLLATPKKDIKGLQFRSSTLSAETNRVAEEFTVWVLNKIMSDVKITISEIYTRVAAFELRVYNSLQSGERKFLQTVSVKDEEEYVDPDVTGHFYYTLWHESFVPEFDGIQLPNKCYKLPLRRGGAILKDPTFVEQWVAAHPTTHPKFQAFCAKWPKKKIASLLIPPTLARVPEFLLPALDVRAIVHDNCSPLYLTLESLGIGLAYTKSNYLVTDFFNPSDVEIDFT